MLEDDKSNVIIKSTNCKIVLTGLEGDNVILMQTTVSLRIDCLRQMEKEIICDAFLADFEIETEEEKCCYEVFDKSYNLFDKIVGSAAIGDDMIAVSKVICTSLSRNILVNTYYDDGRIIVEGVLAANVVYMNVVNMNFVVIVTKEFTRRIKYTYDYCLTGWLFANNI